MAVKLSELSDNWETDSLGADDMDAPVDMIHLCALRNDSTQDDDEDQDDDDGPPTNHWTLCLQLTPSSAVMLDMIPGYGDDDLSGKIQLSSIPDVPYTNDTLRVFSFRPAGGASTTVADVVGLIARKGRDAYDFSPEWEGCRYWMSVVVADMEAEGFVAPGSAETAKGALTRYWRNPGGSEARDLPEGTFRAAA